MEETRKKAVNQVRLYLRLEIGFVLTRNSEPETRSLFSSPTFQPLQQDLRHVADPGRTP
jgi:hypothetical protein